ncbi:MAG: sugar phosphate nucleotidyltransferase [Pseudomonadota bacterium]
MKGVILAGGTGSRLDPLTRSANKHMLTVGQEPMIWHPVRQLALAGITDVMVITGSHHLGSLAASLGDGRELHVDLTYRIQAKAGGIGDALQLARSFAGDDPVAVLLGDNIFERSIEPHARAFETQTSGARVLLAEVPDPKRYGVAELRGERITGIEEKPSAPKSHLAVVGCYFYDQCVWTYLAGIKPSARGEIEITAVNNRYIEAGELQYGVVQGGWVDAGTFDSLHAASSMLLANRNRIQS